MVEIDIDPDVAQYQDVLSRKLQEHVTLAKQKEHVRSIEIRDGEPAVFIHTVGEYIPDPLRQDVNTNDLAIRNCKRTTDDGVCLVFARLEVIEGQKTPARWDVTDDWR